MLRFFRWLFRRTAKPTVKPGVVGITVEGQRVIMAFWAPLDVFDMSREAALAIAAALVRSASTIAPCQCARCRSHARN